MTIARIAATGRGRLQARLVIEGLAVEFVSCRRLEGTSDDQRVRVMGLRTQGLVVSSSIDRRRARIESGSIDVQIDDLDRLPGSRHGRITAALWARDTSRVYLTASATQTDSVLYVSALPTPGPGPMQLVHIGTECISYGGTSGLSLTACVRGRRGTIPQAHYVADGEGLADARVTTLPQYVEGRRAYLYLYGDGDSPSGLGTLVWRGVCATDLGWDRGTWSVTIDSVARILDQPLGRSGDPLRARGIHYSSGWPWWLSIRDLTSGKIAVAQRTGYYETMADAESDIDAAIVDALAEAGIALGAGASLTIKSADGGGAWAVVYRGRTSGTPQSLEVSTHARGIDAYDPHPAVLTPVAGASAQVVYHSTMPRGAVLWGTRARPGAVVAPIADVSGDDATLHRIYLAGYSVPAMGSLIRIGDQQAYVEDRSDSERWIMARITARLDETTEIETVEALASGTAYDLVQAIVSASPTRANAGESPLIHTAEILFSDAAKSALSSHALTRQRSWYATEQTSLRELLEPELVAAGCYMRVGAGGRIYVDVVSPPLVTDTAAAVIDDSVQMTPSIQRSPDGVVGLVRYAWGYSPTEDEHRSSVSVRDVQQASAMRSPVEIAIEQRSIAFGESLAPDTEQPPRLEHVVSLAVRALGAFGGESYVVQITSDARHMLLRCGDVVTLSSAILPGGTDGTAGISGVPAIVVAHSLALDSGRVEMALLVGEDRVSAYHLGADLSSVVTVSGTTVDCTVIEDKTIELPRVIAGQEVTVYTYDSASPAVYTGTVVSVSGSVIRVLLGSVPGSWTGSWCMRAGGAAGTDHEAAWARYAYLAGGDHYVSHASTDVPGSVLQ